VRYCGEWIVIGVQQARFGGVRQGVDDAAGGGEEGAGGEEGDAAVVRSRVGGSCACGGCSSCWCRRGRCLR